MTGKELFIRFTVRAFRKLLSIYVFGYVPFGFKGRIWDLIVCLFSCDLCIFKPLFIPQLYFIAHQKISPEDSDLLQIHTM